MDDKWKWPLRIGVLLLTMFCVAMFSWYVSTDEYMRAVFWMVLVFWSGYNTAKIWIYT